MSLLYVKVTLRGVSSEKNGTVPCAYVAAKHAIAHRP